MLWELILHVNLVVPQYPDIWPNVITVIIYGKQRHRQPRKATLFFKPELASHAERRQWHSEEHKPARNSIIFFLTQAASLFIWLLPSKMMANKSGKKDKPINSCSFSFQTFFTHQVAQRLKHLPTMRETWVRSLGREDLLEKEMATHSSILAWRIPWKEEPGKVQSLGSQRVWHDWSNLVCNIRSTPLPLIFRVPVSWTQTAIYSLFTPWSHLLFCMLEDFCFTAGNRAEYFLLGCNLLNKGQKWYGPNRSRRD